jgi:hypothetical protein
MIDRSGHSESTHFMSHDLVLHLKPELYITEIPDGDTWYDVRSIYWHALKISELMNAASRLLSQLQHVEIEVRTSVWGEILMTHLTTTYKDNIIWIGKHNLNTSFWHFFSRGLE